jgi:hypothetical protein
MRKAADESSHRETRPGHSVEEYAPMSCDGTPACVILSHCAAARLAWKMKTSASLVILSEAKDPAGE